MLIECPKSNLYDENLNCTNISKFHDQKENIFTNGFDHLFIILPRIEMNIANFAHKQGDIKNLV